MAARKKLIQAPPTPQVIIPSGDLRPATPLELNATAKAFSTWITGKNNPMWNDQDELAVIKLLGFTTPSAPVGNTNINDRFSKRYPVADLNIPRNPSAMIQLSMRYGLENAFVSKASKVKTDFICKDFQHKTHKSSAKDFYDNYARSLMLKTKLRSIVWFLEIVGLAPIYWGGEDGGPIQFVQVLNPLSCEYLEILGKQKLFLKITQAMVDAVRDPMGERSPMNKLQYDSMPAYWVKRIQEIIKSGNLIGTIELQEGSYAVVDARYTSCNMSSSTLDGVPLQAAFDALQRYRLLAAGDFAVAWNIKHMVTIISEGDPKIDPSHYTPLDDVRMQKLEAIFLSPDYSQTVFADPTTNIRFFVPPMEVFGTEKYRQPEKEIKEVMNLPSFMWHTEGNGTFGAAIAEMKLLIQEVDSIRMLLEEQFFYPLYNRLRAGASRPKFAQADICLPVFDKSSLMEDALRLQNMGELNTSGAVSLYTLMENSGLDPEWELEQKALEHAKYGNTSPDAMILNNTIASPLWEPSQGQTVPKDKGGNPGKPGTSPSPKPRQPRKTGK